MTRTELIFFRAVFVLASLWNLAGGIPGYFDSANMFQQMFGQELTDPIMLAVYKGSWGTTFLYFVGYLVVARNPLRHTGIVLLGGIGKVFFLITLLKLYFGEMTSDFALIVIAGDIFFVSVFLVFFYRLKRAGETLL